MLNTSTDLRQSALDCVAEMGDVFWDFDPKRDVLGQYRDPRDVAADAVEKTLLEVVSVAAHGDGELAAVRAEYENLIADLPDSPKDAQIIRVLVDRADWTEQGAREVLQLARRYGTSILQNALALSEALGIEDGEVGM